MSNPPSVDSHFAHFGWSTKNLKEMRQFPPLIWNQWNGWICRRFRQPTTHYMTCWLAASILDHLSSSSASTGGSSNAIGGHGYLLRKSDSTRFDSHSNKVESLNEQQMLQLNPTKAEIALFPWKRRSKFPVVVPWISLLSNSWHFPRSPSRHWTESVLMFP